MSSLPGANIPPPVQAIPTASPVTRSNPDRKRREQQQQPHHEGEHKREQDSADLTHHEEPKKGSPPTAHIKPPDPDSHPHIDVQG